MRQMKMVKVLMYEIPALAVDVVDPRHVRRHGMTVGNVFEVNLKGYVESKKYLPSKPMLVRISI